MILKAISFIFLISAGCHTAELRTEVKFVQTLFRHGDRTPVRSYPNDPYNETTWEKYGGFGQLTQTGMKQHYDFGRFIRARYTDFLNKFYNRNNIKVFSTDIDRTLMSAYSLLNGLYMPIDYQVWNENVNWQPIPVHTTNSDNDKIFYGAACPRMKQLKNKVENSAEYQKLNNEYQDLFDIIDKNSGCGFKSGCAHMNLDDEWKIGNCLFVEKTQGLKLPEWIAPYYERLIRSLNLGFYFMHRLPEMAKLTSGGLLNDMRTNILNRILMKNSTDQIRLYSGHDTYVNGLARLLNLTTYNKVSQPPYASAITLELRKEMNKENYFVQVFFKNNTGDEPIHFHNMKIHGCDMLCPIDKFMEITENMIVDDFPNACEFQATSSGDIYGKLTPYKNRRIYLSIGLIAIVMSIIVTILIVVQLVRKSRHDECTNYKPLDETEPTLY